MCFRDVGKLVSLCRRSTAVLPASSVHSMQGKLCQHQALSVSSQPSVFCPGLCWDVLCSLATVRTPGYQTTVFHQHLHSCPSCSAPTPHAAEESCA